RRISSSSIRTTPTWPMSTTIRPTISSSSRASRRRRCNRAVFGCIRGGPVGPPFLSRFDRIDRHQCEMEPVRRLIPVPWNRKDQQVSYYIAKTVDMTLEDAVAATKDALAKHGFGVLTEIDIQATMKMKLDLDMGGYRILGACNPKMASRALA